MAQQSAEDIGKNLRAIRQLRGLSMSALAAASSVSKAMISKIERGDGGVSATTLGKLAEALEVGISDLLSKDDINSIIYLPADAQPVLHDSARGFVRRALSPIFPGRGVDVVHNELGPGGRTYTRCGTAEYMAPEIPTRGVDGNGYGIEVDWWAFGVLVYELFTKRTPFNGPTSLDCAEAARQWRRGAEGGRERQRRERDEE